MKILLSILLLADVPNPNRGVPEDFINGAGVVSSSGISLTAIGSCSGAADDVMVDNNGIIGCQKLTDVAPQGLLVRCQPAFAGGTQTACQTVIAGGQDETKIAIDGADPTTTCPGDNDTVTVTVYNSNGAATATVLTEGTEWIAVASVATTCANLATAVAALAGVGASCTSPNVLVTLDSNTAWVTLAESTAACTTVSTGTAGGITLLGQSLALDGTIALPAYSFASDPDTGLHRRTTNTLDIIAGGAVTARISSAGFSLGANQFTLAAGTPESNSPDIGFGRAAAGVAKITNGSTGGGRLAIAGAVIDVGTTCTAGEVLIDTGGVTVEICVCTATDTIRCVATATTNPVD